MTESRFGNDSERGQPVALPDTELTCRVGNVSLTGYGADGVGASTVADDENRGTSADQAVGLADSGKHGADVGKPAAKERLVILTNGIPRTYHVTPDQKARILKRVNAAWPAALRQQSNDDLALTSSSRRTSYGNGEDRPAGERYSA